MDGLLSQTQNVPLNDLLALAGDGEEYLRLFRLKASVAATQYLPETIEAVGQKAAQGDLKAADMLFEITGVKGRKAIQVATQVNLFSPGEREALRSEVIDVE